MYLGRRTIGESFMSAATRPINVVAADVEFLVENGRCFDHVQASSVHQLPKILDGLIGKDPRANTLDLSGHSTNGHHLLRIGDTVVDMLDIEVARTFAEIANSGILVELCVVAVRLLGCETAVTDSGKRTLRMLSHTLGMPAFGTRVRLVGSHYNESGFDPIFSRVLIEASGTDRSSGNRPVFSGPQKWS